MSTDAWLRVDDETYVIVCAALTEYASRLEENVETAVSKEDQAATERVLDGVREILERLHEPENEKG